MKTREVQPCGILFAQDEEYFLLRPSPEKPEMSWENWNTFRWLVVPRYGLEVKEVATNKYLYGFARHIITNSFTVEYRANMEKITIEVLDEYDILEDIPKMEKVNE